MKYIIKWENRYSHETGYVMCVRPIKEYFENTYDQAEAKDFSTYEGAENAIQMIRSFKNPANNDYSVEKI